MGTERNQCEEQRPRDDLPRSKNSALIAQHSVLSVALCTLFLAVCSPGQAQQPAKIPRIGYLTGTREPTQDAPAAFRDAFRQGLRDLGYIEGKNIQVQYRYVEATEDRVPSLVAELLQLKMDVLVSPHNPSIRAAKQASKTIPIVIVTTA